MPSVFISYRRDSAGAVAGRLRDRLVSEYGHSSVFIDVDTIKPGDDFRKVISSAVGDSDVLLAVIDERWNPHVKAPDGSASVARLDSEDDFVRIEVASALAQGVRVVPVLYKKAQLPAEDELPADLQGLTTRQAVRVTDETWDSDVRRLIDALGTKRSKQPVTTRARTPRPTYAARSRELRAAQRYMRAIENPVVRGVRVTMSVVFGTFGVLLGALFGWFGLSLLAEGEHVAAGWWVLAFGVLMLLGGISFFRSIRSDGPG